MVSEANPKRSWICLDTKQLTAKAGSQEMNRDGAHQNNAGKWTCLAIWVWVKIKAGQGKAGFSPWFHLLGFQNGYPFLSHSHMSPFKPTETRPDSSFSFGVCRAWIFGLFRKGSRVGDTWASCFWFGSWLSFCLGFDHLAALQTKKLWPLTSLSAYFDATRQSVRLLHLQACSKLAVSPDFGMKGRKLRFRVPEEGGMLLTLDLGTKPSESRPVSM